MTDAAPILGLAVLARIAFSGGDMSPVGAELLARTQANPEDASAWLDLSIIAHLRGQRELGLAMQEQALLIRRTFRIDAADGDPAMRVLALLVPGDLTENNALEFLLEGSDIQLDLLYVTPELQAGSLPRDYDLAVIAVGESDRNRPVLEQIATLVRGWSVPVLDAPERIAALSRDTAAGIIGAVPGVEMPYTARLDRATLERVASGALALDACVADARFPVLVRPLDSHKGQGLARLDGESDLAEYLQLNAGDTFYIARFVEYRSPDGRFRKYRILFIDGEPYLYHMAISDHYIVHYMSAGMAESEEKRSEEAHAMATFDHGVGARHRAALAAVAERLGLAYVGIDCGETPDGALVIFEADASLTIHAMDPVDLYPYKEPQMRRLFAAFRAMLLARGTAQRAEVGQP